MLLHQARDKIELIKLIEEGHFIEQNDSDGYTPLHCMVQRGDLDCVIVLLSNGANINATDHCGNTPLHVAVKTPITSIIQSLIIFGADVNYKNDFDKSPRHILVTSSEDYHQALFMLDTVGANRCTHFSYTCNEACKEFGSYNGIPDSVVERSLSFLELLDSFKQPEFSGSTYGGRVLCLDGGGVRGLILIMILSYIEECVGAPILHCFDWISGTSTGAILALGLASGKTIQEGLCFYFRLKDKVFNRHREEYSSKQLESILKEVVGDAKMRDIKHPKLMVMSLNETHRPADLHIFRNYYSGKEEITHAIEGFYYSSMETEMKIWEVARASAAAPTYFKKVDCYVDGGFIANNPTLDTLTEINEYNLALRHIKREHDIKQPSVIVSVGTGISPKILKKNSLWNRLFGWFDLLCDQTVQTDGRVVDRARSWCNMINVPYFRFSPPLIHEVTLDETDNAKLVQMLWETKHYIIRERKSVLELKKFLIH